MGNPLISVIVPVYNGERYLDRCIVSILRQDYIHFELILVNDGSTDQSGIICEQWAEKDSRIKVYSKENGGLSSARNHGLDYAQGSFISFVDADDELTPDALSYLYSLLPDNERCTVTACNHWILRDNHQTPRVPVDEIIRIYTRKEALEEALFHGYVDVSAWAKLYKKEVFQELRYPEGRLFEDTWLFGEVMEKTDELVFGSHCCYYYRIHDQSLVRQSFSIRNLQYIEAAEKLASDAEKCSDDLKTGGIRRINHARLSVLRYMESCDREYRKMRASLRKDVLRDAPKYINHIRTPKRDKAAIILLRLGFPVFFFGWRFYSRLRE